MSQDDLFLKGATAPADPAYHFQLSTKSSVSNPSVTQDYDLIYSIQRLDLRPKRLLLSAISKINPMITDDSDVPARITITADDWSNHWGINKRNAYRDLKDAAEGLVGKRFWINNDTHVQEWRHWVSGATYVQDQANVVVELDRKLLPFLCGELSLFSSYKLSCVRALKTVNALRLYELLNQFALSGVRQIDLGELREALNCVDKHRRWADFNRAVLRKLIGDINAHSNLEVHYSALKTGREVTSIRFLISKKAGWTTSPGMLPN